MAARTGSSASTASPASSRGEIRVFLLVRNELTRLPWLLAYYRDLGVDRFLVLDNDSDDGTRDWLLAQGPDVHLFHTEASFAASGAGMRWTNRLLDEHGSGRLVPHGRRRRGPGLPALRDGAAAGADRLPRPVRGRGDDGADARPLRRGAARRGCYAPGQSLIEAFPWFDATGYVRRDSNDFPYFRLHGGCRARMFHEHAAAGPVLQKVPLIRWRPEIKYTSSKHTAFPCRLADVSGRAPPLQVPAGVCRPGRAPRSPAASITWGPRSTAPTSGGWSGAKPCPSWVPPSRRYRHSAQLLDLGLMHTSPAFEAHVHDRAVASARAKARRAAAALKLAQRMARERRADEAEAILRRAAPGPRSPPATEAELAQLLQAQRRYGEAEAHKEHVLFFAWGMGGNGKGVVLNSASGMLGDYAAIAPQDMLLVTQATGIPATWRCCAAARLVVAQELAPGGPGTSRR